MDDIVGLAMAATTNEYIVMLTAAEMLEKYQAAEIALLEGKTIVFDGYQLTRENLNEIRAGRVEWQRKYDAEQRAVAGLSGVSHYTAAFRR